MLDLEERIIRADDIERILKAVRKRYAVQYPDWEVVIEKSADRSEQLDRIITMLQHMKT